MLIHSLFLICLTAPALQDPAPKAKPEEASKVDLKDLEKAIKTTQRKAEQAEMELELARLKASDEVAGAELAHADKERSQDVASRGLALFTNFEAPEAIADAQLALDRAENGLISDRQDLEGILNIYAEETEARSKDEIIRRHRIAVSFSERRVDAATKNLEKTNAEVESRLIEKTWAVEKADRESELSARAVRRAELGAKLTVKKAEDELAAAQEAVAEAKLKMYEASFGEDK